MDRRLTLLAPLLLAACSGPSHWYFSDYTHAHAWSYEGETGPDHWAELSPEYHLAADGRNQSPIDLPSALPAESAPALWFQYRPTDAHWVNNGHTLQHEEDCGNYLYFDGDRYELMQYHLHTPSEHTVDGVHLPAEVHFVHEGPDGRVLVMALFVEAGDEHDELVDDLDDLPIRAGDEADLTVRDPMEVFPADRSFWWYDGSFTTPPCTEGVQWIVLREPTVLPDALVHRLGEILGRNNRPVCELNGREIHASP